MNSILLAPGQSARLRGRVLVVEPDPSRASAVREAFREYDGIALEIVERSADAIRSLEKRMPDVLLTSTLLPPSDAESLTQKLKHTPAAAHVQIITSPYFIDAEAEPSAGRVLNCLRRRSDLA